MGFSWASAKEKRPAKLLQRYQSLARCNPSSLPVNLVKELLDDGNKGKIETKLYIKRKCEKDLKYGEIPKPSVIVKRMNRVV